MSLDDECAICLEFLEKGDLAFLDCQHFFHLTCINNWLSYGVCYKKGTFIPKKCPLCNTGSEITKIKLDATQEQAIIPIEDNYYLTPTLLNDDYESLETRLVSDRTDLETRSQEEFSCCTIS